MSDNDSIKGVSAPDCSKPFMPSTSSYHFYFVTIGNGLFNSGIPTNVHTKIEDKKDLNQIPFSALPRDEPLLTM